jgi:L-2-hydroxyglutarate oxidase LhgO
MLEVDVAIVGGGIVGLASAWRYALRFPGARVVVLEKEDQVARHQSGRNSGVIHSGIYYEPGSLKAKNCRRGKAMLEAFCREQGIAFETCGKVVVAVDAEELPRLATLQERARANGVACERIGPERLREIEPHAAGLAALHVPETGIVDYRAVGEKLSALILRDGGDVRTGARVVRLRTDGPRVVVETTTGDVAARCVVNCAGLHSDRVLEWGGGRRSVRIVPFRGEYYELTEATRSLCRHLIYPVPDPRFPFLGVHFTRGIHGAVECGPNAVLALAREGYAWGDVSARDAWDVGSYPAFWRFAARHFRTGIGEVWRSLSRAAFTRALQRLVPSLESRHLTRAPSGVRAQALAPEGALVDDFLIQTVGRMVHICNAPSPAATSSLSIGEHVVDRLEELSLVPKP